MRGGDETYYGRSAIELAIEATGDVAAPPRYFVRQVTVSFAPGARCDRRAGSGVIELAAGDGAGADSLKMVAASLLDGFVAGVGLERREDPAVLGDASCESVRPTPWSARVGGHRPPTTRPVARPDLVVERSARPDGNERVPASEGLV